MATSIVAAALSGLTDPRQALEVLVTRDLVPADALDPEGARRRWRKHLRCDSCDGARVVAQRVCPACSARGPIEFVSLPGSVAEVVAWGNLGSRNIATAESNARVVVSGAVVIWAAWSAKALQRHHTYTVMRAFRGSGKSPAHVFSKEQTADADRWDDDWRPTRGKRRVEWTAMREIAALGVHLVASDDASVTLVVPRGARA